MDIRSFSCTYCTINGLNCPDFLGFSALEADTTYNHKGLEELTSEQKSKLAGTYTFGLFEDETCTKAYQKDGTPVTVSITIGEDGQAVTSNAIELPVGEYWIKETESVLKAFSLGENRIVTN